MRAPRSIPTTAPATSTRCSARHGAGGRHAARAGSATSTARITGGASWCRPGPAPWCSPATTPTPAAPPSTARCRSAMAAPRGTLGAGGVINNGSAGLRPVERPHRGQRHRRHGLAHAVRQRHPGAHRRQHLRRARTTIAAGTLQVGARRHQRQPGHGQRHQRRRAGLQPQRHAHGRQRHQRQRRADAGRPGHHGPHRRQQLHRRHHHRRRHAAGRRRRHQRQPGHGQRHQQRHAGLQPQRHAHGRQRHRRHRLS